MEECYYKSPIGIVHIVVDDEDRISRIAVLDDEPDETAPATSALQMAVAQLKEYFAGKRLNFELPLQQPGSPFQQRVWQQLMAIKYGTTITYTQQSKLMNDPLAIRAIAAANGKNNLWIVVPCHRVIGSDGNLTGYAGGVWRKRWLLDHEAKVAGVGQTSLF